MRVRDDETRGLEHAPKYAIPSVFTKVPSTGIFAHHSDYSEMTSSVEHSIELRVRYAETDQMQVVYHSHYLVWCEVGRTELMRSLGQPYASVERTDVALAVVDASLRYLAGARYDDLIRVTTRISAVKSRSVTFDYTITHAESGVHLVSASTTLVSLGRDGRIVALPRELREILRNAI